MKQCEPLKEPLQAPTECAPDMPGLRSRRRLPMGHVGIVTCDTMVGGSDVVAIDTRTQELPKVFVLKDKYEKMTPDFIRDKEQEAHCILVPVDQEEMERIRQEAIAYTMPPEMPKVPEVIWKEPSQYYGGANLCKGHKHIGGRQEPKDYAKKKKAKRRQQKQPRRHK